jgi:NAD(P)H-flavin reductase
LCGVLVSKKITSPAKGRRLQNYVRDRILKTFRHLKSKDVVCVENYVPGPDIILSKVARKLCPYQFEIKNQEKMKTIYDFLKQASKNARKSEPVVVMKMNTRSPIVVIDFEHFLELISPE